MFKPHPSFIVIGLDDNRTQYFPPSVSQQIREGRIFSGGLRHHEIVAHLLPQGAEWINITVPLDNVFARYQQITDEQLTEAPIIVFASGDPLFFGFANTLKKRLPEADITVYPFFNSLQTLSHRLVMPYEDMRIVSLTGRPWQELDRALIERASKIGILTDREHTPASIAQRMLAYGYTYYIMYVGERLGNENDERIRRLTLPQAVEMGMQGFEHPNNVILVLDSEAVPMERRAPYFGIPDEQFVPLNGRTKMITKAPIRLLTLSALQLSGRHSLWDIGFCTGSISIEARLQFPHLTITAFEIRSEGEELMRVNTQRLGAPGITAVIGNFLETELDNYPRPDAVFIGGHGGELKEIIARVRSVLLPGGIMVFNSVSAQSKSLFIEAAEANGFQVVPGLHITLNQFNPIEILTTLFLK